VFERFAGLVWRVARLVERQGLIWLAGFAVIAIGIVCLYLSDAVARTGSWWQGTLDAFGVGFIVGGLIDVLAITGLNQALTGGQQRRATNREAQAILTSTIDVRVRGEQAKEFLIRNGRELYPALHRALVDFIDYVDSLPKPK
jgi:hypothetical protein